MYARLPIPLLVPRLVVAAALTCALAAAAPSAQGQAVSSSGEAPLFRDDAVLEMTLTGPLHNAFRDRGDDRDYHPARLTVHGPDGDSTTFNIRIRARGHFRRLYIDCDVPPLHLNFKKSETPATLFEGQNKLKLVTHCRDRKERYEQYTLQEYLAYRAYNLFTDASFRVRLVRLTYVDTDGRRDTFTRFGFLIENDERLAERLGGRLLETGVVHQEATDRMLMTQVAVFQYMIGNTDWTVPTYHNIKLVFVGPGIPPLPIPYDFDFAGIVDTPYAHPDTRLGIRSVRDRLFRGYCRTDEEFQQIFERFTERRDALTALYSSFPYLDEDYRDDTLDYLNDFFDVLESPRSIRREFRNRCQVRR